MVVVSLVASLAFSSVALQSGSCLPHYRHQSRVRLGLGLHCKCVTAVLVRLPWGSRLATVELTPQGGHGLGDGHPLVVCGMHDPPACGYALLPRQTPRDLSLKIRSHHRQQDEWVKTRRMNQKRMTWSTARLQAGRRMNPSRSTAGSKSAS